MAVVGVKPMRWWAVRIGESVEIRSLRGKPKTIISKLVRKFTRMAMKETWVGPPNYYKYEHVPVEDKVTLKQTFHEGGKVLLVVPLQLLTQALRIPLPVDGMVELDLRQRRMLVEAGKEYRVEDE